VVWMRGRPAATVALALVAAACGGTPSASSGTTSAPGATATDGTAAPGPTTVTSSTFEPDSVVVTIVDGVRVRSRPEISAESALLEPLLPRGTPLFVLEGPVEGSGYDWYRVAPITLAQGPDGWVAKGSRDGIPWLETGSVTCPAAPASVPALWALTPGQRLACFRRQSITVRGKLLHCRCEIDGPPMDPSWFGVSGRSWFLVEPTRSAPFADVDNGLLVVLDPAGTYPDPVPMNRILDVTGMFDHPAAAACTMIDGATAERTPSCRFTFAITSIVPAG
jgi:hypothetical protein